MAESDKSPGVDPFAPVGRPLENISIAQRLREKGPPSDDQLWESCEPLPLDQFQPDENADYTLGFTLREMNQDGSWGEPRFFPLQCMGVAGYSDWVIDRCVLPHVRKVAQERYGYSDKCGAQVHMEKNFAALRRQRAAQLLPIAQQSMPKGKQTLRELEVTEWNREAIQCCGLYVRNCVQEMRAGRGLFLRHGMTGSGKTSMMVCTVLDCVRVAGLHAVYIFVPKLLSMKMYGPGSDKFDRLMEAAEQTDLLILDDIDAAVKPASDGDPDASMSRQVLLRLINSRIGSDLPLFANSSTGDDDLFVRSLGDRILSRLGDVARMIRLDFGPQAWDWRSKQRRKE